jgi:hypothetical protein
LAQKMAVGPRIPVGIHVQIVQKAEVGLTLTQKAEVGLILTQPKVPEAKNMGS